MRPSIFAALATLLTVPFLATALPVAAGSPKVEGIAFEGTEFVVRLGDGRTLRSRDLVGAVLDANFGGKPVRLRLAAVERDPDDATGTVWLHTIETQLPDGTWRNHCNPGPDGRRQSFPLDGPNGVELVCSSGNIAKCVRFGYRRWAASPDGQPLAPLHAACMNMLSGNYGGDHGWTRNGMKITLYDFHGVQPPDGTEADSFEAGWGPDGAVCVHHVRVKENVTLAELEKRYPKLRGRTGAICTPEFARANGAVLFNHSKD